MPRDTLMAQAAIEDVGRLIAECLTGRYLSILLIGSAARGEITVDSNGHILSDLDFLVVLPQTSMTLALLEIRHCRSRLRYLDSVFTTSPFAHVSVGLATAVPRYWEAATPLMWELRTTGRVFYGSDQVLGWPAVRTPRHIPQWEGIRLIANRLCELIARLGCPGSPGLTAPDPTTAYACMKLVLACSEAALIGAGLYVPTCRQRFHQHARVGACFTHAQNMLIESAYRLKLDGLSVRPQVSGTTIREMLRLALATLAGFDITGPDHFVRCLTEQSLTAPGLISDALFWTTQSVRLRGVPFRHAITDVYADAYRIAERGSATGALPAMLCRSVTSRYGAYPQVVSVLPATRQIRLAMVREG